MFQVIELLAKLTMSSIAFAQEAAAPVATANAGAPPPPGWMQFVPFAVIIAVFYFFMIRPQAKKQREMQSYLSSLKVGEQVITSSGILGRITAINENIVTLEIANQVQIKMMRAQVLMPQSALQEKKEGK